MFYVKEVSGSPRAEYCACLSGCFCVSGKAIGSKSIKGEIKYSGNRVCEVCGQKKGLSSFCGHDECDECTDKALNAYHSVVDKLVEKDPYGDDRNEYLRPSKNVYMKDYLERMAERRLREEEE